MVARVCFMLREERKRVSYRTSDGQKEMERIRTEGRGDTKGRWRRLRESDIGHGLKMAKLGWPRPKACLRQEK